jgi:putative oxidoreductase
MTEAVQSRMLPAGSSSLSERTRRPLDFLGRAAIAFLFLSAARYHVSPQGWDRTLSDMAARGVPFPVPAMLLAMAASSLLALALLLDVKPRLAALGLSLYTISVSLVMYTPFVGLGQMSYILFLKDCCIFGALLSLSRNLPDTGWRPFFMAPR